MTTKSIHPTQRATSSKKTTTKVAETSQAGATRLYTTTFDTPCGPFSLAVDERGALVATVFGGYERLQNRVPKGTTFDFSEEPAQVSRTSAAKKQILEYFAGKRREFTIPLSASGTQFQQSVWTALATIPFGETRSYGQLAADMGNPNASRAVGGANGANPICLIVPCHRVIGADGSLTGFEFGEKIKRQLLELEGALPPQLL